MTAAVLRPASPVACALLAALLLATRVAAAQSPSPPAPADLTVRFRERAIDLAPFFEGFPYTRFRAEYEADRLIYFRDTRTTRELWTLPLAGGTALDPARGTRLGTVDWNRRGLRAMRYHPPSRRFIVTADDANEERFNLFALALDSGELRRLTDKPYLYGFGLDKQHTLAGYLPRYGATQPYRTCLNLLDLASERDREVVCDTPAMPFTWGSVNFRPDGSAVVFVAQRNNDRNYENLVYVDLAAASPAVRVLTDPNQRRRNVDTVREWIDANHFVYTSDESGFTNVYLFDLLAGAGRAITRFTEDIDDVVPLMLGQRYLLAVLVVRPYESEVFVVDPLTDAVLARHRFDASEQFLDYQGDHALLAGDSRRTRFALEELRAAPAPGGGVTLALAPRAQTPPAVAQRIERCAVERVQVPTFDTDPRTGARRVLHAYLQTPRVPPARAEERFAFIEAFYGGENRFDTTAQILCDAGAIVLSPAVRGSSGFGAEFAALNDHDLGGNEIFDVVHAGRYLTRRFGLPERAVGVYGGSHGGYATMRALTMPPAVNGRREPFAWGFGVSWYGFSDIVSFYERCNIPDWVLLEAGDPRTEAARLHDRSPLAHAARAVGPLLLLHGENDRRVPVGESRQMAAALRRAGRPVTYVEFAGQGHGLKGVANQHRVWRAVFAFLEQALDAESTARRARTRRMAWIAGGVAALVVALGALGALRARRRRTTA